MSMNTTSWWRILWLFLQGEVTIKVTIQALRR